MRRVSGDTTAAEPLELVGTYSPPTGFTTLGINGLAGDGAGGALGQELSASKGGRLGGAVSTAVSD